MALAALTIAVLALLVAAASALYTKKQADAAAAAAALEADRRHEERTPTFDAWIEAANEGGWHRLWVRLTSRHALSAVEVQITEGEGVEFTTGQYGVPPGATRPVLRASKWGEAGAEGMAPDARTAWQVTFSESRPPEIRLKIEAAQHENKWSVTVPVSVPPDLVNIVF